MKLQNRSTRLRPLGALLAAACAVPALTGCLNERVYTDPAANLGGATSALNLSPGNVRGDFGPYRGIDGPATDVTGDSDSGLGASTVKVGRQESASSGMIILWVNGQTLERMPPGVHRFTHDATQLDTGPIAVNFCGGESLDTIDYDTPAEEGTVTITPQANGERLVEVNVEGTRLDPTTMEPTGERETANASFVLHPAG